MVNYKHTRLAQTVWDALHGCHSNFSNKTELACVYKKEYMDFSALAEYSEQAYQELATLVEPNRKIYVWGSGKQLDMTEWKHLGSVRVIGMVLDSKIEVPDNAYVRLTFDDVDDMIVLTELADMVGDFNKNRLLLGDFYGIKEDGKIIAMAGERIQTSDYIEVANVCTHPDFRRRGFGGGLSCYLSDLIFKKGKTPYLHVFENNIGAIRLYEKLGFKKVFSKYMDILQRTDQ